MGAPGVGGEAIILAYHRVAEREGDFWGICTPPGEFRAEMDLLRREYQPLALEALCAAARGGRIPERAVAVTLDDGYADALEAAEILAERGVPATFFVTTAGLEGAREFWWDALTRLFLGDHPLPPRLELRLGPLPVRLPTATIPARTAALAQVYGPIRGMGLEEREAAVERLLAWGGLGPEPDARRRPMLTDELVRLAGRPGVSIGCHTENHLCLPGQPGPSLRREVAGSKARLEALLGRRVSAFAYPFGGHDEAALEAVRGAAFTTAVTTYPRPLSPGADPLALPRYEVGPRGGLGFGAWLRSLHAG